MIARDSMKNSDTKKNYTIVLTLKYKLMLCLFDLLTPVSVNNLLRYQIFSASKNSQLFRIFSTWDIFGKDICLISKPKKSVFPILSLRSRNLELKLLK